LAGYAVRCGVGHADALDRRRERALQREIATERQTLAQTAQTLARQRFACAADAEQAHATTLAAVGPRWHRVTATVIAEAVPVRRRGRPRRDGDPETTTAYRVQWTLADPDAATVHAERQRRSPFVLVTDDPNRSARELVAAYKGQDQAEHAFRWAKHPWHLQVFCLQNPRRVAGLGFLLLLALQFVRWMRRMVRDALRDHPPLALPDGRQFPAPSDEVLLDTLRPRWLRRRWTRGRPWYQWGHVPPHAQRVLEALGIPLYVRFEPG
jgi:transposase